ncbi:response regulator transcription factor [Nocardioides salsibiostraticola]
MNSKLPHIVEAPLRVALVDDCELVSAGLTALLASHGESIVVMSPTSFGGDIDVVLFDPLTPPRAGRADLRHWTSRGARVVVYSWDVRAAVRQLGEVQPSGYLSKRASADQIVNCLRAAARGERSVAPDAKRLQLVSETPGRAALTVRESEVLSMIVQGLSNEEICRRDYVTNNTLKSHIRNLYRKIGVTRRSQAVLWGAQNGYLPPLNAAARDGLSVAQ